MLDTIIETEGLQAARLLQKQQQLQQLQQHELEMRELELLDRLASKYGRRPDARTAAASVADPLFVVDPPIVSSSKSKRKATPPESSGSNSVAGKGTLAEKRATTTSLTPAMKAMAASRYATCDIEQPSMREVSRAVCLWRTVTSTKFLCVLVLFSVIMVLSLFSSKTASKRHSDNKAAFKRSAHSTVDPTMGFDTSAWSVAGDIDSKPASALSSITDPLEQAHAQKLANQAMPHPTVAKGACV
jgi:hypothetical protein